MTSVPPASDAADRRASRAPATASSSDAGAKYSIACKRPSCLDVGSRGVMLGTAYTDRGLRFKRSRRVTDARMQLEVTTEMATLHRAGRAVRPGDPRRRARLDAAEGRRAAARARGRQHGRHARRRLHRGRGVGGGEGRRIATGSRGARLHAERRHRRRLRAGVRRHRAHPRRPDVSAPRRPRAARGKMLQAAAATVAASS